MSKLTRLAQINKIANDCIKDGDFELAAKFHNQFMRVAQVDDAPAILRSRIAKGMGLDASVSDGELIANIIRICDYIKPERLRDPSQVPSPNNVLLRSMGGATPENSYADEYWQHCQASFSRVISPTMMANFKNKCDYIRKAARNNDMNAIMTVFGQS